MLEIRRVKTFHGTKWAVTEPFVTVDKEGKKVVNHFAIEYKGVNFDKDKRDIRIAVFPHNQEGLEKARELKESLSK